MADVFSARKRSWVMSRIRGVNTNPEKKVCAYLRAHRIRFRRHAEKLPGRPDVVLPEEKTAIFIHGCFWHGHGNCKRATLPKTRAGFWMKKIDGNRKRDQRACRALRRMKWRVMVLWECQLKKPAFLDRRLGFLIEESAAR